METIVVAAISAMSGVIVAVIQRISTRKERADTRRTKEIVEEQLENEHLSTEFPNNRDELTEVRMIVQRLESAAQGTSIQLSGLSQRVDHLGLRLNTADRTLGSLEDTLEGRDQHTDNALSRAIDSHDRDVVDLKSDIAGLHIRLDRLDQDLS